MAFEAEYQSWLGIIGGLVGIGVAVATYFRGVIQQNEKIVKGFAEQNKVIAEQSKQIFDVQQRQVAMVAEQNKQIFETQQRQVVTDTKFNVFWSVIEKELPKVLIKPHREDIDQLLKKMQHEGLTEQEKLEMKEKMREALNEGISNVDSGLALGYALLIARIESEQAVKGERLS
jgi:hypothetical protein